MLRNVSLRSPIALSPPAIGPRVGLARPTLAPLAPAAPPISATVLTKNSERRLDDVLRALAWCDEVVVLDTGSDDRTLQIARSHTNVSVHEIDGPFPGFGVAHRQAVALARNDWILSIDSDEIVTDALKLELQRLRPDAKTVYAIPFHNMLNGRLVTSCGWYPDRHDRLFHRGVTNFCSSDVHERVQTRELSVQTLSNPVRHFSYESSDDFLRKMRSYSQLFANQHAGRKASSPGKALRHGLWAFIKSYGLQRGFMQGYDGFVISAYKAQSTFWKYLCLHEANQKLQRARGVPPAP